MLKEKSNATNLRTFYLALETFIIIFYYITNTNKIKIPYSSISLFTTFSTFRRIRKKWLKKKMFVFPRLSHVYMIFKSYFLNVLKRFSCLLLK